MWQIRRPVYWDRIALQAVDPRDDAEPKERYLFLYVFLRPLKPSFIHLTQSREPQDIATVHVGGKSFKIQKALLVKDSNYFDQALNNHSTSSCDTSPTITLDGGISAINFGLYVDILFRSYFKQSLKFRTRHMDGQPRVACITRLWRLADRFVNRRLLDIVEEALDYFGVSTFTVATWEEVYQSSQLSDSDLWAHVRGLQTNFYYCVRHNLAIKRQIVEIAANMPPQLFNKHHDDLDRDFRSEVSKGLLKRLQNPNLKRPSEDAGGNCSLAAKRRQH